VTIDDTDVDAQDDDDDTLPERTTGRLWLIQCKRERAIGPAKMRRGVSGSAKVRQGANEAKASTEAHLVHAKAAQDRQSER
jgi:hypothetical protein